MNSLLLRALAYSNLMWAYHDLLVSQMTMAWLALAGSVGPMLAAEMIDRE